MICPSCGTVLTEGARFCHRCGASLAERQAPPASACFNNRLPAVVPPEYQPLSPWTYFGLSLLYSIPVIGFIFLIVFSISGDNINRRNFTRSYWCGLLLALILLAILLLIVALTGVSLSAEDLF